MQIKKTLVLLTGLPGSGKSTIGKELERLFNGKLVSFASSDAIRQKIDDSPDRSPHAVIIPTTIYDDILKEIQELQKGAGILIFETCGDCINRQNTTAKYVFRLVNSPAVVQRRLSQRENPNKWSAIYEKKRLAFTQLPNQREIQLANDTLHDFYVALEMIASLIVHELATLNLIGP